jgi:hypothetical protein
LTTRKQGPEQNQDDNRHNEPSFEQASHEINDFEGLRGFRYRQGVPFRVLPLDLNSVLVPKEDAFPEIIIQSTSTSGH